MMPANNLQTDLISTGFILDTWYSTKNKANSSTTSIYGIGKDHNGETFGFVDQRQPLHFYIREADAEKATKVLQHTTYRSEACQLSTMDSSPLLALLPQTRSEMNVMADKLAEEGIRTYEADMEYSRRFLMGKGIHRLVDVSGPHQQGQRVAKRFINPVLEPSTNPALPALTTLVIDIETDREASMIYAVSLVDLENTVEEIFVVTDEPSTKNMVACADEKMLLRCFAQRIIEIDPDIITGWNVIDFDFFVLDKLFRKYRMPFVIGRSDDGAYFRKGKTWGSSRITVRGRQVIDTLHLVRFSLNRFEDFRLDTVAKAILDRGKTLEQEEWEDAPDAIDKTYREDLKAFCEYCIEDSRLVRDILIKEDLIDLTAMRAVATGLPLERAWSSIAAFDFIYTAELRKKNMVAPSNGVDQIESYGAPGGLVMEPKVGHHHNILVFDFKSLYPSIIRTFNIDPLALIAAKQDVQGRAIEAPNGECFSRELSILPNLLEHFHESRNQAKANKDELRSYTYKIIMNSCYGVMGSSACRFRCGNLAGAVTSFGQYFLSWTRKWFEGQGYDVLYGDTDSLFVDAIGSGGANTPSTADKLLKKGNDLCEQANKAIKAYIDETWQVTSNLELEFEKYYQHLLFPPARGNNKKEFGKEGKEGREGRAKSYAGLAVSNVARDVQKEIIGKLEITGLEAVRSDWTVLAHEFQVSLLEKLFSKTAPKEIESYIKDLIRDLKNSQYDDKLVYRKRIKKPLDQYVKTTPPHVKAARLLPRHVSVVRYLVTQAGPQPLGFVKSPIDYKHYIEKQLKPIAQSMGAFGGFNAKVCQFGPIQQDLFEL